jgi:hypothetical protein
MKSRLVAFTGPRTVHQSLNETKPSELFVPQKCYVNLQALVARFPKSPAGQIKIRARFSIE